MLPDHYATLGIAPNSHPAAIRAAYLDLMRRYHPDRNPCPAGATRARAITGAYAILAAADQRAAYDLERTRLLAAKRLMFMPERPQWRLTPLLAIVFGIAMVVLLLPLLISPPLIPPQPSGPAFSAGGPLKPGALEQDQNMRRSNPSLLQAAVGGADMVSLSDDGLMVSTFAGVAQMPQSAADQLDAPAALENGARNELANVVEQSSPSAQPPEAAVARAQGIQPRPEPPQPRPVAHAQLVGRSAGAGQAPAGQQPTKAAWQRPLPPIKPAWQRPLPPSTIRR